MTNYTPQARRTARAYIQQQITAVIESILRALILAELAALIILWVTR